MDYMYNSVTDHPFSLSLFKLFACKCKFISIQSIVIVSKDYSVFCPYSARFLSQIIYPLKLCIVATAVCMCLCRDVVGNVGLAIYTARGRIYL